MTGRADAPKQVSERTNSDWFNENVQYMETQERLPYYRWIAKMVNRELAGAGDVLDVGNGGFFNYDTTLVRHVTALDLFLNDGPGPAPNTTFRNGSVLDMPFEDGAFDYVVMQNVLHHVTGTTVANCYANMQRALAEIHRCLKPGGSALVIESTVADWFYTVERLAYPLLLRLKRGGHPVTLQYTPGQLLHEVSRLGFEVVEYADTPSRGMVILQFGYRWPTALTPARAIKLALKRRA